MKTHDQVICDFRSNEFYGGATCPFCGERVELTTWGQRLVVDPATDCPHADMAVDAGSGDVAIHFIKNRGN